MSENPEGPGWWIASDGQWYPPELHPSARAEAKPQPPTVAPVQSQRWRPQAEKNEHVGPQFPDLFQKALQGSHLADNVSVKYSDGDERSATGYGSAATPAGSGVGVSSNFGPPEGTTKRRWRKGH